MTITIVNISQGPYELNKEAIEKLDLKLLSFNITSRLRYSVDSDYVGFQIDLSIMQQTTQVFKSGFLVGMAIADWSKDLQNGLDLNNNREKLTEICRTVWLVATGIVALQTADSSHLRGIILPDINYEAFSKDVILIPNTSK